MYQNVDIIHCKKNIRQSNNSESNIFYEHFNILVYEKNKYSTKLHESTDSSEWVG